MAGTDALPAGIDGRLAGLLQKFTFAFVVSDCSRPDMPIVFASSQFYNITGYQPDEVIGKNCRFLQGPETERRKVMEIRDAIREDRCCQVCLTNYRKDGSKFLNQFFLSPIKDDQGIVTHYAGIQTDITAAAQRTHHPQTLIEQQAAVELGQAAGCSMCDTHAQQQQVAEQLQQQPQRSGQQQQEPQQQQGQDHQWQTQEGPLQQQHEESSSDEDADVMHEELQHAGQIATVLQQSQASGECHLHAECQLPASLLQPLVKLQQSFVLAAPHLPDCPIVHVSDKFLELMGYSREEVLGRNCRFLQGPNTDPLEVKKLRDALSAQPPQPVTVILLNYTKQGRPFYNALHIAPVRDADGRVEYYIGIQLDASEVTDDGQQHAPAKLHLSHKLAHYSVTGAVRVACRGLSGSNGGLRRSLDCQGLIRRGYSGTLSGDGSSLTGSSRRMSSAMRSAKSWAPDASASTYVSSGHAAAAGAAEGVGGGEERVGPDAVPHQAASAPLNV